LARQLAPELSRQLHAPVVVENMPGANGLIGMQRVRNAGRDERVLVLASDHATAQMPHADGDLAVVGLAARYPYALVVAVASGVASLRELQSRLRSRTELASIAVPAEGGIPEHVVDALSRSALTPITAVPYRGGNPAVVALLGGHVTAAVVGISNVLELHRQGRIRILAVSGAVRSPAAPEAPTFAEEGVAGVAVMSHWALYAPKNTLMDVAELNDALRQALSQPDAQRRLRALGLQPVRLDVAGSVNELDKLMLSAKTRLAQ
jgi:tripartite-type tricarboxylate transporter receptor subunit TctC